MEQAAPSDVLSFQRVTVALGTFVAIQARGLLDSTARVRALDRACEVLQTIDAVMHPTAPGADPVRIAQAPPGSLLAVHPWTFEVLSLSLRLWRSSAGHFDPCIPASAASIGDLQLVEPASVRIPARTTLLDLGGIAKGLAIDKAVDVLIQQGCSAGLVNAGGDMRAFGPHTYEVDLQIPRGSRRVQLAAGALAVSAPKSGRSPPGHLGFYSRVTGAVLPGRPVGVLAPTAAVADALTKCAIACPPDVMCTLRDEFSASVLTFGIEGNFLPDRCGL